MAHIANIRRRRAPIPYLKNARLDTDLPGHPGLSNRNNKKVDWELQFIQNTPGTAATVKV
jgi:hypothetical protein